MIYRLSRQSAQFIHESVRDIFVGDNGTRILCPESPESFESAAHEQLKQCCARGLKFDLQDRSSYPFTADATRNALYHADKAAAGIPQHHFLKITFDLSSWTTRLHAFQGHGHLPYNGVPSWSYVCAERDLTRLLGYFRPYRALPREPQDFSCPLMAAFKTSSGGVAYAFLDELGAADAQDNVAEAVSLQQKVRYDISDRVGRTMEYNAACCFALEKGLKRLAEFLLNGVVTDQLIGQHDETNRQNTLIAAIESGSVALVAHIISIHQHLRDAWLDVSEFHVTGNPLLPPWPDSAPLLWHAICSGHFAVVEFLMGADADATCYACIKINRTWTASVLAAYKGHADMMELLIAQGANPSGDDEKHWSQSLAAVASGKWKVVEMLLAKGARVRGSADDKSIAKMLARSEDIVNGNFTAQSLEAAAGSNYDRIIFLLLKHGADVSGPLARFALQTAVQHGHERMVTLLLEYGVDVDGTFRATLLENAAVSGDVRAVTMMLKHGANVDGEESRGGPLLKAAILGCDAIVELPIVNGAAVDIEPRSIAWACPASRKDKILAMLEAAGASQ